MRRERNYSDRKKATALVALALNNGNESKTARAIDIPRTTIQEWRNGRVDDDLPEIRREVKGNLADEFESILRRCLNVLPSKIEECSGQQIATIAAICVDKIRILREDQPPAPPQPPMSQAQRYERALEHFMKRAEERGMPISRAKALKILADVEPEILQHLPLNDPVDN